MESYNEYEHINCGAGTDITILELVKMLKEVTSFDGDIIMDSSKPDGTPRKLMDSSRIRSLGWKPGIELSEGLNLTYEWFKRNVRI